MANQRPNYKKLFFEEQHLRKAAEEKIRKTTLLKFLDACHNHHHAGLAFQTDADPTNANNMLRPERILAWKDFPAQQAAI
jgi:hypothetical protein